MHNKHSVCVRTLQQNMLVDETERDRVRRQFRVFGQRALVLLLFV
jgi:hypothetical protein